jgi:hypothetical protein
MAEVHRMTVDEVVSYFVEGEGVDVLRDSLRWVCQQLMEAEVSGVDRCQAGRAGAGGAEDLEERGLADLRWPRARRRSTRPTAQAAAEGWRHCSKRPNRTCSPSTRYRASTGRSSAPPIRSSASTARSDGAATSSASSRTTAPSRGSPPASSSSRTTSGSSAVLPITRLACSAPRGAEQARRRRGARAHRDLSRQPCRRVTPLPGT